MQDVFVPLSSLSRADCAGRVVLLRADFNLPMQGGQCSDVSRAKAVRPSIRYLLKQDARLIVLMSHFGRPEPGRVAPELSMKMILPAVQYVMEQSIPLLPLPEKTLPHPGMQSTALRDKTGLVMLENLRFHPGEAANDLHFAEGLAAMGDFYVNDAFSVSHRAHASVSALASCLPAYAGLALEAEVKALRRALETPKKPLAIIIGGAKISSKINLLHSLVKKADLMIIGGGMAHSFLKAQGCSLGRSFFEPDSLDQARAVIDEAKRAGCRLLLPVDLRVAPSLQQAAQASVAPVNAIPTQMIGFDIGPASSRLIQNALSDCRTILVNGPLGVFEHEPFDTSTREVFLEIARRTKAKHCLSVAGGGDTVSALNAFGGGDDFSYTSTAGGAFLAWLEGQPLPGLDALARARKTH